jgi:hypothetical protein
MGGVLISTSARCGVLLTVEKARELAYAILNATAVDLAKGGEGHYLIRYKGYCGDACLWWCPNGAGYTTNIDLAGRFTKERAMSQERCREIDQAVPESVALAAVTRHVMADALFKAQGDFAAAETQPAVASADPAQRP